MRYIVYRQRKRCPHAAVRPEGMCGDAVGGDGRWLRMPNIKDATQVT